MQKRLCKKTDHFENMIQRAKELAKISEDPIADLYLIHADICQEKQKLSRPRRYQKKP